MAYLVHWDSSAWDVGSLFSSTAIMNKVVSTRQEALSMFRRVLKRARRPVEREVNTILSDPKRFVFDSGYSYWAIVIELPRGMRSAKAALSWITEVAELKRTTLQVVAGGGSDVHPPDGRHKPLGKRACLEHLLDSLG
jgi:hypothetical protein